MQYTEQQQNDAMDRTEEMFHAAADKGAMVFETPGPKHIYWIPWRNEIVVLSDTKTIGHALVMAKLMPSNIPMREFTMQDFIDLCQGHAVPWDYAPRIVRSKYAALRISTN